jgi:hypothetical protein
LILNHTCDTILINPCDKRILIYPLANHEQFVLISEV